MQKPPIREPQRARPQFTVRTIIWLTSFVAIFAACGLAIELLMGIAWLALAPAVLLLMALLQYPLMKKAVQRRVDLDRASDEQEALKELRKPSS